MLLCVYRCCCCRTLDIRGATSLNMNLISRATGSVCLSVALSTVHQWSFTVTCTRRLGEEGARTMFSTHAHVFLLLGLCLGGKCRGCWVPTHAYTQVATEGRPWGGYRNGLGWISAHLQVSERFREVVVVHAPRTKTLWTP